MTKTVGSGEFTYEVEEDWAKLPDGWEMNTAAVAGDSMTASTPSTGETTPLWSLIGKETTLAPGVMT